MKIAKEKKETNIAEYILFMWQTEDIVRAMKFDLQKITELLIRPQFDDPQEKKEAVMWYEDIIHKMNRHNILETGHLPEVNEVMMEVAYVHNLLMNILNDVKYKQIFEKSYPVIKDYQKVSKSDGANPIESCFHGLYAKMLLRLKGEEITPDTEKAFEAFRKVLVYLTKSYHKMQSGDLNSIKN